jgi:DNA-directed RNA polymerase sigma subunit (sigma70/sigma32)
MPTTPEARHRFAQRLPGGVEMKEITNGAERLRQVVNPSPDVSLATPQQISGAEHKPLCNPAAAVAPPGPRGLLTADQERVMVEHLPIVRIIAWRIHGRLPPQVPIEDLYSAGVVGLLDAFGRFDSSKQVLFRTYAQFRIGGAILDSLRTLDWRTT